MARVAFVQSLSFEYLGTEYLCAVLKANGHEVEVFIDNEPNRRKFVESLVSFKPDILAFSCTTGVHRWALEKAQALSSLLPGALRTFGGPHPTFFPEIIEHQAVDIVCRGEGEGAIVDLAHSIDSRADCSSIANLWVKRNGNIVRNEVRNLVEDLDRLPYPDRSVYFDKYKHLRSSRVPFLTGRGCPYDCSYCFNQALRRVYKGKGTYIRRRSPINVVSEIDAVKNKYTFKRVYFQDDTFTLNGKWLEEFLPLYRERIGLPFICLITADTSSEENIELLKNNGCSRAFFGIESGDEILRQKVLNKKITDIQIRRTAERLKKHRIRFRTYNMAGVPGETLGQAFRTIALNREIGTDYPWCSLYTHLPGTKLAVNPVTGQHCSSVDDSDQTYSFFTAGSSADAEQRVLRNLQKLFLFAVKWKISDKLMRKIVRMPPNPLFDLIFLTGYAWGYMGSEQLGLMETASIGFRNVRRMFSKAPVKGKRGITGQ